MKTKTVAMYECEVCGATSLDKGSIEKCEHMHREIDACLNTLSKWGQNFIKEVGIESYKIALELLEDSNNEVEIYETDERGFKEWAVAPAEDLTFWFQTFKNRKDAEDFCKEMGWEYA